MSIELLFQFEMDNHKFLEKETIICEHYFEELLNLRKLSKLSNALYTLRVKYKANKETGKNWNSSNDFCYFLD